LITKTIQVNPTESECSLFFKATDAAVDGGWIWNEFFAELVRGIPENLKNLMNPTKSK